MIKTLKTQEIYKNKWIRLREDSILRESGEVGIYSVVEKEDFVIVLAVEDEFIYVVKQYRYPIGQYTIELPQGAWETQVGADPLEVAQGELKEETGLTAAEMTYIGYQKLANGLTNQGYSIFIAKGLTQGETQLDSEEFGLTTQKVLRTTFEQWLMDGTIIDASTSNAYLLAQFKGYLK